MRNFKPINAVLCENIVKNSALVSEGGSVLYIFPAELHFIDNVLSDSFPKDVVKLLRCHFFRFFDMCLLRMGNV